MKIWYAPYELVPLKAVNRFGAKRRRGFLVKISTTTIEAGYADCHSIPEFGDPSIDVLIKKISSKSPPFLVRRALQLAKIDGLARTGKKRLLSAKKVKSHFTCADIRAVDDKLIEDLVELGYATIKVKIGTDPAEESKRLNRLSPQARRLLRWRFDANSGAGERFLENLDTRFLEDIDFIEDPVPFRKNTWTAISKAYRIECAYDQPAGGSGPSRFRGVRIVKPARTALAPRKKDIITNSMDHPVGQSFAVLLAQNTIRKFGGQTRDYGLQTVHLFKNDAFFDQIATPSPYFHKSDDGYGIGFQSLLEKQKWRSV